MKKFILLVLTCVAFLAQDKVEIRNPGVYSALGDAVYNNLANIENLQKIESYNKFSLKIHKYSAAVKETKKLGYEIESGKKDDSERIYLRKLRELSNQNDYFVKIAHDSLNSSIKNEDSNLFIAIVNSGIIDIKKNKAKILSYYKSHTKEIKVSGIMQNIIDKEKAKKRNKLGSKKIDKQAKEKIERIRRVDKAEQEALERKLEEEAELKKNKIREEQERQLFN